MTETAEKKKIDERSLDEILNQEVQGPAPLELDLHDEDTWYPGTLLQPEKTEGLFGTQLKWRWVDDNEKGQGNGRDGADREEWFFSQTRITTDERNKLRKIVKWLTGEFPEEGQRPDLRPFIGARVDVMFERYQGKDKEGNAVERERIYKMRPSRKPAPAEVPF